jgi:hypothetical protein
MSAQANSGEDPPEQRDRGHRTHYEQGAQSVVALGRCGFWVGKLTWRSGPLGYRQATSEAFDCLFGHSNGLRAVDRSLHALRAVIDGCECPAKRNNQRFRTSGLRQLRRALAKPLAIARPYTKLAR